MRYLLDTHALVWLVSHEESRLPESLRDSIRYYEDEFAISEISLVEIIQLQQIVISHITLYIIVLAMLHVQ